MTNLVTLPTAEQSALVALACAGLNGHPAISDAIARAGGAMELLEQLHDDPDCTELRSDLIERVERCGTPAAVARALEATRLGGMRLVGQSDPEWPDGLRDLGRGMPRVLWMAGAHNNGADRPVGIVGGAHPTPSARRHLLEVAVGVLDAGYQATSSMRIGVDRNVLEATIATEGRALITAYDPQLIGACRDHPRITLVSENPPGAPVGLRSARRAHALPAVMSQRILVVDSTDNGPALHAGLAASALGRPLAVLAGAVTEGDDRLRRQFGAREIQTAKDLIRLS
ncbi:MAG TPA: DNA-processing protein DprA [Mycobacterium sp.]|nr:DNA-processing protein DprA [Mycobacterium sp.]